MRNRNGFTIFELLVMLALFSLTVTAVAPGMKSFFARLEVHSALRTITMGLSTARYDAIRDNRSVRAEIVPGRLLLSQDNGQGWREIQRYDLSEKLSIRANSRPVFSPLGSVAPLCTITLESRGRVFRVVVSMYGRIKIYDNG